MQKIGEFWVPDLEEPALATIRKGGQTAALETALKYVTRFGTAMDVGANVGTWTRKMMGKFERVIALEPADDTFECLVLNCPGAICHHAGASDAEGFAKVMPDDRYPTGTGSRWLKIATEGAKLITIDSLGLENVGLMKVDVEGMELRVFRGAKEMLKIWKPVLVVEDKDRLRARHDLEAPWKFLKSLGYSHEETIGCDRILI